MIEKIIESVFINFRHATAITFQISLTSTCISYLNKYLCLACFVYVILSQKYWI
jgi:hypothetical protein